MSVGDGVTHRTQPSTRIALIEIDLVELPMTSHRTWAPDGGAWGLPMVLVRMHTEDGRVGLGHTITVMPEFGKSLFTLVTELSELIVGLDADRPELLAQPLVYRDCWIGPGGLLNHAAAALDIAAWDLAGKVRGQPLWRMLGGFSDRVRVYDSGSLMADDLELLQAAAARSVAMGHRAMKMRPGSDRHGPIHDVAHRVALVREVVGPDVALMYDVNQSWSPARAIRAIHALEEFELTWIEDPVAATDVAGQKAVRAASRTPIALGEYHYNTAPLLNALQQGTVDVLMPDLLRQGGITQFRKVAALAESFNVPVASHIIPEVYAHCIAAIPNGYFVEDLPWTKPAFEGVPAVEDGWLVLSDAPGHGLSLGEDTLRKWGVGNTFYTRP